jgi:hypothetical protein
MAQWSRPEPDEEPAALEAFDAELTILSYRLRLHPTGSEVTAAHLARMRDRIECLPERERTPAQARLEELVARGGRPYPTPAVGTGPASLEELRRRRR